MATFLPIHSFLIGLSNEGRALPYLYVWNYRVTWLTRSVFILDYASKEVVAKAFAIGVIGFISLHIADALMLFVIIGYSLDITTTVT